VPAPTSSLSPGCQDVGSWGEAVCKEAMDTHNTDGKSPWPLAVAHGRNTSLDADTCNLRGRWTIARHLRAWARAAGCRLRARCGAHADTDRLSWPLLRRSSGRSRRSSSRHVAFAVFRQIRSGIHHGAHRGYVAVRKLYGWWQDRAEYAGACTSKGKRDAAVWPKAPRTGALEHSTRHASGNMRSPVLPMSGCLCVCYT
jgi:hypothetical protein